MRSRRLSLLLSSGLAATLGCVEVVAPPDSSASDAWRGPSVDAASLPDVGVDAQRVHPPDALHDAATFDAVGALDAAPRGDAGPPVLHDCRVFEDRRAPDAERTIRFGGAAEFAYEPACILIAAGQTITFSGSFTHHPLAPGRSPRRAEDPPDSPDTPITAVEEGSVASVTFPAAGDYAYHCPVHDRLGMFGVVRVE